MIAWWKKNLAERYNASALAIGTSAEVNDVFDKNPYFGDSGDYVWKGLEFVFTNSVPELAITYPKLVYQDDPKAAIYRFYVPHGTAASRGYLIYQRGWLNSEKAKVEDAFKDFIDLLCGRYARPRTGRGDIAQARLTHPPPRGQGLCPCPAPPPFASPPPLRGFAAASDTNARLRRDTKSCQRFVDGTKNAPRCSRMRMGDLFEGLTRRHGEHGG